MIDKINFEKNREKENNIKLKFTEEQIEKYKQVLEGK